MDGFHTIMGATLARTFLKINDEYTGTFHSFIGTSQGRDRIPLITRSVHPKVSPYTKMVLSPHWRVADIGFVAKFFSRGTLMFWVSESDGDGAWHVVISRDGVYDAGIGVVDDGEYNYAISELGQGEGAPRKVVRMLQDATPLATFALEDDVEVESESKETDTEEDTESASSSSSSSEQPMACTLVVPESMVRPQSGDPLLRDIVLVKRSSGKFALGLFEWGRGGASSRTLGAATFPQEPLYDAETPSLSIREIGSNVDACIIPDTTFRRIVDGAAPAGILQHDKFRGYEDFVDRRHIEADVVYDAIRDEAEAIDASDLRIAHADNSW